jgi:hypothetical protein
MAAAAGSAAACSAMAAVAEAWAVREMDSASEAAYEARRHHCTTD